jgi:hypothetical protein
MKNAEKISKKSLAFVLLFIKSENCHFQKSAEISAKIGYFYEEE